MAGVYARGGTRELMASTLRIKCPPPPPCANATTTTTTTMSTAVTVKGIAPRCVERFSRVSRHPTRLVRRVTTFSKHNSKLRRAANDSLRDKTKFDTPARGDPPVPSRLAAKATPQKGVARRDASYARPCESYWESTTGSTHAQLPRRGACLSGKAITCRHHPGFIVAEHACGNDNGISF